MKRGFFRVKKRFITQQISLIIVIALLVVFIIAVNYSSKFKNIFVGEGKLRTLPVDMGMDDCKKEKNPDEFCNTVCKDYEYKYGGFCIGLEGDPSFCENGNYIANGCCCKYPPQPPPTLPPPPTPQYGCNAVTNLDSDTAACVIHSSGGNCPTQFIITGPNGVQCCCPECWQTSDCPSGYECQFYECVKGCGNSAAPECSGVCPQGKTCKHQLSGSGDSGVCQCYNDPPQSCSDFTPPNCGGSEGDATCAAGEVCSPYYQTGGGSECKCASP